MIEDLAATDERAPASGRWNLPRRPAAYVAWARTHLSAPERQVVRLWLLAHVALLTAAYAGAWALHSGNDHGPLVSLYEHWDSQLLREIAQYGYWSGPGGVAVKNQAAFFPGYPIALAAVHLFVRNWIASELLLSLVAGGVALVALTRLTGTERSATYLLCAPAAVFLMVGYSESLFLAFAVTAWLCAVRGRWEAAGLLAFGAALTRPNGLFFLAAITLLALLRPGRWRALLGLVPAYTAPLLYEAYLRASTGTWNAWMNANSGGWGIKFANPIKAYHASYGVAFGHAAVGAYAWDEQFQIWSLAAMVAGTLVLLARRRWAEAAYVGLSAVAMGTSAFYQTVPRTLLLLFPLWALLGRAAARRPWIGQLYVAAAVPLAVLTAVMYLSGEWAG